MSPELQEYANSGKMVSILGTKIFYQDLGTGTENLILLHGFLSTGFHYRKLALILSKKYRVIVPDLLGMGWSERPTEALSHRMQAHYLGRFLEEIAKDQKVHIVAHDFALVITGFLLKNEPERVKSLTIVNGFLDLPKYSFYFPIKLFRIPVLGQILMLSLNPSLVKLVYNFFLTKKGFDFSEEWAVDTYSLLFDSSHRKNTLEFLKNVDRSVHALRDLEEGVKALIGLRLILISQNDPYVSPHQTEYIKETLRTSSIFYLPAGHFPQEESPIELASQIETLIDSITRKKTKTFHFDRSKPQGE